MSGCSTKTLLDPDQKVGTVTALITRRGTKIDDCNLLCQLRLLDRITFGASFSVGKSWFRKRKVSRIPAGPLAARCPTDSDANVGRMRSEV